MVHQTHLCRTSRRRYVQTKRGFDAGQEDVADSEAQGSNAWCALPASVQVSLDVFLITDDLGTFLR